MTTHRDAARPLTPEDMQARRYEGARRLYEIVKGPISDGSWSSFVHIVKAAEPWFRLFDEFDAARADADRYTAERDALGAWKCAICGCRFAEKPKPDHAADVLMEGVERCSSCANAEGWKARALQAEAESDRYAQRAREAVEECAKIAEEREYDVLDSPRNPLVAPSETREREVPELPPGYTLTNDGRGLEYNGGLTWEGPYASADEAAMFAWAHFGRAEYRRGK